MSELRPDARDPRVDHTEGTRPAVRGGECSSCLHQPPLHEKGCTQLVCRAPKPCACWKCILKAAVSAAESAERALEDQDVDGCHEALARAGISAGALMERVEDVIGERDAAEGEAARLRNLFTELLAFVPDRYLADVLRLAMQDEDNDPGRHQADRIRWWWWRIERGMPIRATPTDEAAAAHLYGGLGCLGIFLLSLGRAWARRGIEAPSGA